MGKLLTYQPLVLCQLKHFRVWIGRLRYWTDPARWLMRKPPTKIGSLNPYHHANGIYFYLHRH
jgi:hypothetical protein